MKRVVGSELMILGSLACFGFVFFPRADATAMIDPNSSSAVVVEQVGPAEPTTPVVRNVFAKTVRLPLAERPAYLAVALSDPSLTPDEVRRIRSADFLLRVPVFVDQP